MLRFNFGIAFIALAFASAAVSTSVSSARRALLSETGSNATSLPGLCDTVEQSSGFVQIETERSEDKHYFYWLFESRNIPSTDPLILWLAGGPGCSGGLALFHELGPCTIDADGSNTTINPHSWNNKANLLFLDQPAGVGFSFSPSPIDEDVNEKEVSEDVYAFLQAFYRRFPKMRRNDLYIFGESFSGHYLPNVASAILDGNRRVRRRLRHRGFRVGDSNNAFFEDEQQQKQEHIVYNHSLYNHTNDTLYNHTNFTHRNHSRLHDIIREVERERIARAEHVREEMMRREREEEIRSHDKIINLAGMGIGNGNVQPSEQYKDYAFTAYNESLRLTGKPAVTLEQYKNMTAMLPACLQMIDECQRNYSVCNASQNFCDKYEMDPYDNAGLNPFDFRLKCDQKANPLCYNMSDVSVFFNRSDVRSALGVTAEHAPVWANCNATINQDFGADVMRDQAHLVAKALDSGVRVLVYAGEMDYTCNAASNRRWVNALSWEHARSFRKAEEVEADGGEWASKTDPTGRLTFVLVHGAGHMVPMDKPRVSLDLLNLFLDGHSVENGPDGAPLDAFTRAELE